MKHFLFFFALLFCGIPTFAQNDLDYSFTTKTVTVFTQTVDSVATSAALKNAKPGIKIDPIVSRDTFFLKDGGLRYLSKVGQVLTIYDPNNPTGTGNYSIQFAGWLKLPNPVIKYNLLNKDGVFGTLSVDLIAQEYYLSTSTRQIFYSNRE
jgi:hypothetical protein